MGLIMDMNYEVCIGLDWADQKHDLAIWEQGSGKTRHCVVNSRPESLDEFVMSLRRRCPEGRFAVCLEQKRGAVVYALSKYDFIDLYPINPASLHWYRASIRPSGAKSDPGDAALLLDFLQRHPERLTRLEPDTVEVRKLRGLCEERRKSVDERTRLTNRLQATLKESFPQALDVTGQDLYGNLALDFLERWPLLQDLQQASKREIEAFYASHRTTHENRDRALALWRHGQALTQDRAVLDVALIKMPSLMRQLRELNRTVQQYDRAIKALESSLEEVALFASFPGAGPALAPRLAAAFGSDRSRWSVARDVSNYLGVSPVTESSGRQHWVHWRWSCPKFLRQTMVEYAWQSTKQCAWARAYYDAQRGRGASHQQALRSLALKWTRIMFRCWKKREPYDESRYLDSLSQRAPWYRQCA